MCGSWAKCPDTTGPPLPDPGPIPQPRPTGPKTDRCRKRSVRVCRSDRTPEGLAACDIMSHCAAMSQCAVTGSKILAESRAP